MEPTIRLDPLAERIDSPVKNYDTGGASIEGACPKHGHLGVIIYGQCATNNIITESKTSLFNELPMLIARYETLFITAAALFPAWPGMAARVSSTASPVFWATPVCAGLRWKQP